MTAPRYTVEAWTRTQADPGGHWKRIASGPWLWSAWKMMRWGKQRHEAVRLTWR